MQQNQIIKKLKNFKSPISIEKFLEISLYDKRGYYYNSKVIGSSGDFITSPEISQLFGDIIGLYILDYWQNTINNKFNFFELGPGRGTLLLDIINVNKKFIEFNKAMNIKLIEKNINLIKIQKNNLTRLNLNPKKIKWSENFKCSKKEPSIILANEFFDCLPIRQFYKKKDCWYEKMVLYESNLKALKIKDMPIKDSEMTEYIKKYKPKKILEISKSREEYFSKICKHISTVSGMIIIIDYGYLEEPKNFTLQSIINNKYSNVLDNIGTQDITSLVDFRSLITIAQFYKLKINSFNTQRDFLIQNGIYQRAENVIKKCSANQKKIIENGLKRIIDKKNMGSSFKVLVLSK